MGVLGLTIDAIFHRSTFPTVAHSKVIVDIPETISLKRVTSDKFTERGILTGKEETGEISADQSIDHNTR